MNETHSSPFSAPLIVIAVVIAGALLVKGMLGLNVRMLVAGAWPRWR